MTSQPKKNFVTANVLRSLIRITAARSGRANQSQSQRLVVRFVRGVLAIGQNRRTVSAGFVRQVDPLMRRNFELALFFVRPLNRADVSIVSRQIIRGGERKRRFQIRFLRFPIDDVAEFDAIAGVTG